MTPIAIDTETTSINKGHPYDIRNDIVCWSWANRLGSHSAMWDSPKTVEKTIENHDLVVFFNGKFDVAWLRRMGVSFDDFRVWDVQLGEFVLGYQLNKFPSLNDTCAKYNIPLKLDKVKEYWDNGVDTKDIPQDILLEYAAYDADLTLQCFYKQLALMTPAQRTLVKLMSADMLVLQEMEQNGLKYDVALCNQRSSQMEEDIATLTGKLNSYYPNVPFNFGSVDQLSIFLFGGTLVEETRVHQGFYKSGIKKDQPKFVRQEVSHHIPPLFKPIKGTEREKEGYYEVNEGVLRKLSGKNKPVVDTLLALARAEKLNGTYYKGLVKLNEEMGWPSGHLHGQLNQTLAKTGRLSSSKPNQQNFATEIQDIFISEFN